MVVLTFDDYRRIPWAEINTDNLTDECAAAAPSISKYGLPLSIVARITSDYSG